MTQLVAFLYFYDMPTKLGQWNKAIGQMRIREEAIRKEAKHLEIEQIALRNESTRLEKERVALDSSTLKMERERHALETAIFQSKLERARFEKQELMLREERKRWEKARDETNIPKGAFWDPVWPTWECLAYGRREYWGVLRNIPNSRDHMDACMNMPVTIEGVTIRRPDRCQYEGDAMRAFWMVDWGQVNCKPWLEDIDDRVSLGKP